MIECQVCTPDSDVKLTLDSYAQRCKYHGKLRKNKHDFHSLAPKYLCPDLFYVAYPYCLALLYDAVINGKGKKMCLRCPNPKGDVKIEIKAKPMLFKPLFNRVEKWARGHGRPLSLTDKRIGIKIIGAGGTCPRQHQPKEQFEFNIGFSLELCPASFHSIYPFIFLIARGKRSRFSGPRGSIKVGCPDAKNVIVYNIKAKSTGGIKRSCGIKGR